MNRCLDFPTIACNSENVSKYELKRLKKKSKTAEIRVSTLLEIGRPYVPKPVIYLLTNDRINKKCYVTEVNDKTLSIFEGR